MTAKPRYTVGTVTGWPITTTSMQGYRFTAVKPSTIAYVYDSVYCYREVAHFDGRGGLGVGRRSAEQKAQAFADKLNDGDDQKSPA